MRSSVTSEPKFKNRLIDRSMIGDYERSLKVMLCRRMMKGVDRGMDL